ncbi:ParB/RepB/Spo0J family partition protein [Azospirillum thermophilum]|uniref:Chromosome partitioning protein n=1 Tax=Azospirillum thermophilum TaxID=2202148 RepID=A0A2S2CZD5_9PROT|nr:ParB/RepB/Spo0J family partition protein [Azospirillum thermophilum]AWK89861.1 chromosome partitioning protein [Azospirillum thermophilum]
MPPRKLNTANLDEVDDLVKQTADAVSLFADDDGDFLKVVALDLIDPNPNQPRRSFDPADLDDLARSIAAVGVIQPILVTRVGDRYQLIAGERRVRASRLAGKTSIKAVVTRSASPSVVALVENIQRADLNALELAAGVRSMLDHHATQREVARLLGKSDSFVSRALKLLDLPAAILEEYPEQSGQVSINAMFEIAEAPRALQGELWQRAKEGAPIKALRAVRRDTAPPPRSTTPAPILRTLPKVAKGLAALDAAALNEAEVDALQALRDQIDALLRHRR